MADKSHKPTPPTKPLALSHTDLLGSYEWRVIQSIRTEYGESSHTLARMAPLLRRLLRRWERQLPAVHQLPPTIRDLRDRVLLGRTFERRPRSVPRFDRTMIAEFMHALIMKKGASVRLAGCKACDRFQCADSSAEKWYYAWRKTLAN